MSDHPPTFSHLERESLLTHPEEEPFDLIVVGGGITGSGIAHDATVRGMKVALLEKKDFGSGTSSRSSNLIHGGLRYLEQLNFKLVFEAVQERALLTKLAPHLVKPIPFLFPVYKGDRVGLFTMRMGLTLYEMLAFFKTYKRHQVYRRDALLNVEPGLLEEGLKGGITYYDCMTSDSRLTLETMISAARRGIKVGNYLQVERIHARDENQLFRVDVKDAFSGSSFSLKSYTIINATGPWSDKVRHLLENDGRMLRPTKGVHVVVPKYRLPVRNAVVMTSRDDRRIIFAIPWPNATIIGTTDTDYTEDIDRIVGDGQDIEYLLEITNIYFPEAKLNKDDIISTWAGVRPLIYEEGKSESEVSREHQIHVNSNGLISILGGKLTTYRHMAVEVVDVAEKQLDEMGRADELVKTTTKEIPLPGNDKFSYNANRERWIADLVKRFPRLEGSIPYLVDMYGAQHKLIIELIEEDPDLGQSMMDSHPYLWAEVAFALRYEMVMTPQDFLRRRTRIYLTTRTQGTDVIEKLSRMFAEHLGWDEERRKDQVDKYLEYVHTRRAYYT